jgi:hydrogenase/urease accessory protein HupE
VQAHEVRPGLLQIVQQGATHYTVTWKQPVIGEIAARLVPHLSNGWLEEAPTDQFVTSAFLIRSWSIDSSQSDPLAGQAVDIEGLDKTITNVIVEVRLANGRDQQFILRPDAPSREIMRGSSNGRPVAAYLRLGIEHILTGIDHLMFVLGLLLLVGIRWRLLQAITAFTATHSITLAASALGIVEAPAALIEALVALSIVFVAAELANAMRGQSVLTQRYPWAVAFTFGLLHGFAFASALAEVGLPRNAIPLSLFLFNVGVEIGQLLFVGAAILAILMLRRMQHRVSAEFARIIEWVPPYAIGSFAALWFLGRTIAVFS